MAKLSKWAARNFVALAQLIVAILAIAVTILYSYSKSADVKPAGKSLQAEGRIPDTSLSSRAPSENSENTTPAPVIEKAQDPQHAAKPTGAKDEERIDVGASAIQSKPVRGRVLILLSEETSGTAIGQGPVARSFGQKITEKSLSATLGSEISKRDLTLIQSALQRLEAGDKGAGRSIPFKVVVSGTISVQDLDPYQGLFISVANGTIKAVDTESGLTVARESIADVRGFGNSQEQSRRGALNNAGEKISAAFIVHVCSTAR